MDAEKIDEHGVRQIVLPSASMVAPLLYIKRKQPQMIAKRYAMVTIRMQEMGTVRAKLGEQHFLLGMKDGKRSE